MKLKKNAYVPKEYTPFKYKVPGVRLPSFNDKQLDRKAGKPITVCRPVLYRFVGIALLVAVLACLFLVVFLDSLIFFILFLVLFIGGSLYGFFGNLLYRWEPDPLPDREFFEAKDRLPTVQKPADARIDK